MTLPFGSSKRKGRLILLGWQRVRESNPSFSLERAVFLADKRCANATVKLPSALPLSITELEGRVVSLAAAKLWRSRADATDRAAEPPPDGWASRPYQQRADGSANRPYLNSGKEKPPL